MTTSADLTEETLVEYIAAQRWYGSKGREVAHAAVVDCAELPGAVIALVEVRSPRGRTTPTSSSPATGSTAWPSPGSRASSSSGSARAPPS